MTDGFTCLECGNPSYTAGSWNTGIKHKIHIYAVNISTFLCGFFLSRKSIKKLVLKNLNSSNLFSPVNRDNEDLASPSEYPENGDRYVGSSGRCLYLEKCKLVLPVSTLLLVE